MGRDAVRWTGRGRLAAGLVAVAALAAACSSGSSSTTSTTTVLTVPTTKIPAVAKDDSIAAKLPASVVSAGTLTVATDPGTVPGAFVAPGSSTIVGVDVDLATAIGQVLGLRTVITPTSQGSLVSDVKSGKTTIAMSSIPDAPAAQGPVDFVDYLQAGQGFFVRAGSGKVYADLGALCGNRVAVVRGSTEQAAANAQRTACARQRLGTLQVVVGATLSAVVGSVSSHGADVGFVASPSADFAVSQAHGQLAVGGQPLDVGPWGIVTGGTSGMAQPVASALNTLITDGTYAAILSKWGLQSAAVTTAVINGAR